MIKNIRKRDGRLVPFETEKIAGAIYKAFNACAGKYELTTALEIAKDVEKRLEAKHTSLPTVELVQDTVEEVLIEKGYVRVAKAYMLYRETRTRARDMRSRLMVTFEEINHMEVLSEPPLHSIYRYGQASAKEFNQMFILKPKHSKAFEEGDIYIHDLASLTIAPMVTKLNLKELFDANDIHGIEEMASQLFVYLMLCHQDVSESMIIEDFEEVFYQGYLETKDDNKTKRALSLLFSNIQEFQQLTISLSFGNKKYLPFLDLLVSVLEEREYTGIHINYVVDEYNDANITKRVYQLISEDSNISFVLDHKLYDASGNSFDNNGILAMTSINLPRIAIKAQGNMDEFFDKLDNILDTAIEQLDEKYIVLSRKSKQNYPFLYGYQVWKEEDIFSKGSLALSFTGLEEALTALNGKHHGDSEKGQILGMQIVAHMRRRLDEATKEKEIQYILSSVGSLKADQYFINKDKEYFGILPGITDHDIYTHGFSLSNKKSVSKEAPYFALTTGHCFFVTVKHHEAITNLINRMKNKGITYTKVNIKA